MDGWEGGGKVDMQACRREIRESEHEGITSTEGSCVQVGKV